VANFGLGVEYRFNEEAAAYAAFARDRSVLPPEKPDVNSLVSRWSISHLSGGATVRFGKVRIAPVCTSLTLRSGRGRSACGMDIGPPIYCFGWAVAVIPELPAIGEE